VISWWCVTVFRSCHPVHCIRIFAQVWLPAHLALRHIVAYPGYLLLYSLNLWLTMPHAHPVRKDSSLWWNLEIFSSLDSVSGDRTRCAHFGVQVLADRVTLSCDQMTVWTSRLAVKLQTRHTGFDFWSQNPEMKISPDFIIREPGFVCVGVVIWISLSFFVWLVLKLWNTNFPTNVWWWWNH